MMNKRTRIRKRPMAEINVVPYIDVMLVLLIIFMVTTPLLSQGVKVSLPQATAQAVASNNQPIIVSVDAQGNYYLNSAAAPDQPVDAQTLSQRVAAELQLAQQQGQQRQVLVKGDKSVDYGRVVQAMVLLQQAGAPSVGLVMQQPADIKNGG
jgi:biopolymer transport protein TolR